MAVNLQILIFSSPEATQLVNPTVLTDAGYKVSFAYQLQSAEIWLDTFAVEALLVIAHHSTDEALKYCAELHAKYPNLSIILVTTSVSQSALKQALELGLVDYLTAPVDETALLRAVQRSSEQQKIVQEWNRLGRVLAGLEDGVILANLDGYVLMVNQSARKLFALGDENLEGKSVSEVFKNPDLLDAFNPQHSFPRHKEISLDDGRVFSAQSSLIPEIGVVVVKQEITHLKELDRVKTDLVTTITHDLRSPLTAIYGFVGLIDRVGQVNEQQAEFIRHIQTSVQHITSLVNDLMDLDQLEADYDIQMEDVNLRDIITRSIDNLDYQMNAKMQELTLINPEDTPFIQGNPLHLQRMVTNLIENAVKFTPPFGKIKVQCRSEASQVILEVTDTGPGIPLEDQPRIFEKFYRGSNLSRDIPGTGLGLSIVKSIVDRHHGRIWLESSPQGTTFTVILPVKSSTP